MGDYDLQIMVAVVFASVFFGSFMFLYAQNSTVDSSDISYNQSWNETQQDWEITSNPLTAVNQLFNLLDQMEKEEIWIVSIFVSAMLIVAVIIGLRFARG